MTNLCGLMRHTETQERLDLYNGIVEVWGSIPHGSTIFHRTFLPIRNICTTRTNLTLP
jgi:hypothetical protein